MEDGLFGVGIDIINGSVTAVLTGDHFKFDERKEALAVCAKYNNNIKVGNVRESPMYLARDSVVRASVFAYNIGHLTDLLPVSIECQSATHPPCGTCDVCIKRRNNAFTNVLLGRLESIESSESIDGIRNMRIRSRLREAVASTLGLIWMDTPWEWNMSDDEVDNIFKLVPTKKNIRKEEK